MQDKLQKIFSEARFIPVSNLNDLMWQRVERKIKLITRVRLSFYSATMVLSVVSLYNSLPIIYSEISSSWFGSFASLIFSESLDNLAVVWKDILYVLVESLPVMSLITLCGIMFVFTLSLRGALIYRRKLLNL